MPSYKVALSYGNLGLKELIVNANDDADAVATYFNPISDNINSGSPDYAGLDKADLTRLVATLKVDSETVRTSKITVQNPA